MLINPRYIPQIVMGILRKEVYPYNPRLYVELVETLTSSTRKGVVAKRFHPALSSVLARRIRISQTEAAKILKQCF